MNTIIIGILVIIFLVVIFSPHALSCRCCTEKFKTKNKFIRKPISKKKVKLGVLDNTPGPLKNIIKSLNKIGGQLNEDKRYDSVATDYLDPSKLH